jgi:hypothetical protein
MSRIIRLSEIYHQNDYDETDDLAIAVDADDLVIPVTHAHVSKTIGADNEALTLANGKPGQILNITITTAGGGTGTLTPATCTGFSTIAFLGQYDTAVLFYVDDSAGWRIWSVWGTDGPPVVA